MSQDKTERMEYFISLLDDYIDNKLEHSKKAEIEQALNEDPFLKEVLRQHVQARANMRVAGEQELRKKFADKFDPIPEAPKPETNLWKILLPLLLLLGLAVGAYYFINKEKSVAEPPLMANVVDDNLLLEDVEDPSYDLLRSDGDSVTASVWIEAVQSFVSNDYSSALSKVVELEADSIFHIKHLGKISLMKGVSNLKLKQYEEAIGTLSKIGNENPYYDQSKWYLALTYFYNQDKSKAQEVLEQISTDELHFKHKQAQQYLNILNQK